MPRKGRRKRIAVNIFDDASGRAIIYRHPVTGKQHEIRRPRGTPVSAMRQAVADELQTVGSAIPFAEPGTVGDGINRLEQIEGQIAGWTERRSELRAWSKAIWNGRLLRDFPMSAVTTQIARGVMNAWLGAGVAPKTVRQRQWTLKHLYRVLGGTKVLTPVDDIPPPPKPRTIPTVVEPDLVLTVYHKLREMERKGVLHDAKTRARFMVRAATGRRPAEIMRAEPGDVRLERREWRIRDAKGGWSPGWYLNDDMVAAWKLFIKADAWGKFNTGAQARTLRSAGWPPGLRPYELRHNVGIALSDAGVDLADISAALGHKDLHTTRRTYVPIRNARMQRASEAIEGRFNGWAVPATVPAEVSPVRHKAPQNAPSRKAAPERAKRRKSQGKSGRKRGGSA